MMRTFVLSLVAAFVIACNVCADESEIEKINMETKQKVIGIIGGTSWESTVPYYKLINQSVRDQLGDLNSAKIVLYSVNYEPIVQLEREGKWDEVGNQLAIIAKKLQEAGADFLILSCNTLHKATPAIEGAITIPFLHIADAAGVVLTERNFRKIGLLGTQLTMEESFYSSRLQEKFGLHVMVPDASDRKEIDRIIYQELCQGKIVPESKNKLLRIIETLQTNGAEAVLLGCTELGMVISQKDASIPTFDTTVLHANEAVRMSMNGSKLNH
jgi:aspartate racemase